MKKSHIILAAVPVVCALGGFGAGQLLKGNETHAAAHQEIAPATEAEGVLHSLADGEAGHAPAGKTVIQADPGHDEQHSAIYGQAQIMPASFTQSEEAEAQTAPSPAARTASPVEAHRLDPAKLAEHARQVAKEKAKAEKRKALEAKMAEIESTAAKRTRHPALLPVDVEAQIHEDAIKRIEATDDHVVKLGRITLPVEGAAKTTYYVADFGVSVTNLDQASYFYDGQNAARLRDQVMTTLHELAPTQLLRSDRVNSEVLAKRVTQDLREKFAGVEDFLFLSLYKTDIPRS